MDVREKMVEILRGNLPHFQNDVADWNDEHIGELADHLISKVVTVQEWVSVDDRLPNPFESVLVFRDGKISIDYNEENGWFAYDLNGKRVTHWMPMPHPPKGE